MSELHTRRDSLLELKDEIEAALADVLGYGPPETLSFRQDCIVGEAAVEAIERWMDDKADDPALTPTTPIEGLAEQYREAYQRHEAARARAAAARRTPAPGQAR